MGPRRLFLSLFLSDAIDGEGIGEANHSQHYAFSLPLKLHFYEAYAKLENLDCRHTYTTVSRRSRFYFPSLIIV